MEKPEYKVGDVIYWYRITDSQYYQITKVNSNSYSLISLFDGRRYPEHGFDYTHGITRLVTKLAKALK